MATAPKTPNLDSLDWLKDASSANAVTNIERLEFKFPLVYQMSQALPEKPFLRSVFFCEEPLDGFKPIELMLKSGEVLSGYAVAELELVILARRARWVFPWGDERRPTVRRESDEQRGMTQVFAGILGANNAIQWITLCASSTKARQLSRGVSLANQTSTSALAETDAIVAPPTFCWRLRVKFGAPEQLKNNAGHEWIACPWEWSRAVPTGGVVATSVPNVVYQAASKLWSKIGHLWIESWRPAKLEGEDASGGSSDEDESSDDRTGREHIEQRRAKLEAVSAQLADGETSASKRAILEAQAIALRNELHAAGAL